MLLPFSVAPRLIAIAASGAAHAMVVASLAFTTTATGPLPSETLLFLDTQEQVPPPPVVAPAVEPVSEEAPEAPLHPNRREAPGQLPASHDHDRQPRVSAPSAPRQTDAHEVAAPDFLERYATSIPPTANVPVATDEVELPTTRTIGTTGGGDGPVFGPQDETTYGEDDVSTPAKLLSNVDATYPMQAWSSGIEADVPVEIVVDARGSVVSARVVTRAGHGFDDAALASIKSYRFAPAQRDGHAVRVRVRWSIQFRWRR